MKIFLRIYDYFSQHRPLLWIVLALLIVGLMFSASQLRMQENILDFLPLTENQRQDMQQYQTDSHADCIFILFSAEDSLATDVDEAVMTLEDFYDSLVVNPVDLLRENIAYYYEHIAYYLTTDDYVRMDSLLTDSAYIPKQMDDLRQQLLMPLSSGFGTITYDPLHLFPTYALPSQQSNEVGQYDAAVILRSPYGQTESARNAVLVSDLKHMTDSLQMQNPSVSIRLTGAPVISVTNARQIKRDSVIAITLALVLILLLLFSTLRNIRSLMLIVASTAFGMLFAAGIMGMVHPEMSLIVIGIASVIVGITVNYPLHVLVHRQYTDTVRQTLAEVLSPLIVGNITTVGAFLTLLPLQSVALRDLGLFAACMLVGTILFTVVVLPHIPFSTPRFDNYSPLSRWLNHTSSWQLTPRARTVAAGVLVVVTIVLGIFSQRVEFDSNLSHINFMTEEQRIDLARFSLTSAPAANVSASEVSTRWEEFWQQHASLGEQLDIMAENAGFRPETFAPFKQLIVSAAPASMPYEQGMPRLQEEVVKTLSNNFDYIGLACSLVVFAFLWISFRRLRYALVAFLPMAVSWLWILGLMYVFGWQFNIVNIILATFIFGQGDDYTIFITEGILNARRGVHGGERLVQYKNSIILSALIMFIGIGVLIVARHPAMHSLATVTMLGMSCVVLMAYIVPPMLFTLYDKIYK